jgi:hypothetical protein
MKYILAAISVALFCSSSGLATSHSPYAQKRPWAPESFTPKENRLLRNIVIRSGNLDWEAIAIVFAEESDGLCRTAEVLKNHWVSAVALSKPPLGQWTANEERLLVLKIRKYGMQYDVIASFFLNKTAEQVQKHAAKMKKILEEGDYVADDDES